MLNSEGASAKTEGGNSLLYFSLFVGPAPQHPKLGLEACPFSLATSHPTPIEFTGQQPTSTNM